MTDMIIIATMMTCAALPFMLCTTLTRRGKHGANLTIISLIGAIFVILYYAAGADLGIDPVQAIAWAMVLALPAFFGALAGTLLGWLLRRRDEKSVP